jgi:glycogen(starch) synthase
VGRRVLLLSWEYPPLVEGGLARHVGRLAEGLAAGGEDVCVLTRGRDGDAADELRAGVRVRRVAAGATPRDLDAFLAWVAALNADLTAAGGGLGPFDVVHGHDWLVARAGAALAARLDAPFVTTIHATEHGRHAGRVQRHPQSHVHAEDRRMARRAARVIVCSRYMRAHVAEALDLRADRITVIPNGVDALDPRPAQDVAALRARHVAPDERLLLLTGRLVYEKGFQVALDALPAVVRRFGRVRFVVAGDGPHRDALEAQAARLGLATHGAFLGWAGDDALEELYRIADLCVVPSLYEPFGMVALEAMAAGCPCVVADTGGLREVVAHRAGMRVPPGDARALADAVTFVLANPAVRLRMAGEGRAQARRFAWADVARRTAAVYAALVPERGAAQTRSTILPRA